MEHQTYRKCSSKFTSDKEIPSPSTSVHIGEGGHAETRTKRFRSRVPPRCTARTVLRTLCYLSWGANILGDEQTTRPKRTLVNVPFIADISWRKTHPRVAHVLDRGADGTAQTLNTSTSSRDLTATSPVTVFFFFKKTKHHMSKRQATMKPNKRQLASWVLTTLCEMNGQ